MIGGRRRREFERFRLGYADLGAYWPICPSGGVSDGDGYWGYKPIFKVAGSIIDRPTTLRTSDAMNFLARLLREDAGKASMSYVVMAVAITVIGIVTACSIHANLMPR